jgi:hypothetical protein
MLQPLQYLSMTSMLIPITLLYRFLSSRNTVLQLAELSTSAGNRSRENICNKSRSPDFALFSVKKGNVTIALLYLYLFTDGAMIKEDPDSSERQPDL